MLTVLSPLQSRVVGVESQASPYYIVYTRVDDSRLTTLSHSAACMAKGYLLNGSAVQMFFRLDFLTSQQIQDVTACLC